MNAHYAHQLVIGETATVVGNVISAKLSRPQVVAGTVVVSVFRCTEPYLSVIFGENGLAEEIVGPGVGSALAIDTLTPGATVCDVLTGTLQITGKENFEDGSVARIDYEYLAQD